MFKQPLPWTKRKQALLIGALLLIVAALITLAVTQMTRSNVRQFVVAQVTTAQRVEHVTNVQRVMLGRAVEHLLLSPLPSAKSLCVQMTANGSMSQCESLVTATGQLQTIRSFNGAMWTAAEEDFTTNDGVTVTLSYGSRSSITLHFAHTNNRVVIDGRSVREYRWDGSFQMS